MCTRDEPPVPLLSSLDLQDKISALSAKTAFMGVAVHALMSGDTLYGDKITFGARLIFDDFENELIEISDNVGKLRTVLEV